MKEGPTHAEPRPRRLFKTALYAFAAAALVIAGTIGYLIATFDPRDYHDRIVGLVMEKTGRALDIQGAIGLSFWPDVAVRLGALSLSERENTERFASVENARLRLKLRPLFSREIVASELVIAGAIVRVIRHEDGRLNIDDLFKGEGPAPRFDVERVRVERSRLDYADLASGTRLALGDLNLETGRIAPGVVTPVALSFTARDAGETFVLTLALKGGVEADLDQQRYALHDADIRAAGPVGVFRDVDVRATGSIAARMPKKEFSVDALSVSMKALHAKTQLSGMFEARRIAFAPGVSTAGLLRGGLVAAGSAGPTDIKFESASISRVGDRLTSEGVTMNVTAERAGLRAVGVISTPLDVVLSSRQMYLAQLAADVTVSGQRLRPTGVRAIVKGDGRLDFSKEALVVRLIGKVADSMVKARVTAAGLATPAYTFDVSIDQLDLDRYATPAAGSAPKAQPNLATASGQHLLDPFVNFPATGTLTIGSLKTAQAQARNVRLVLR